MTRKVAVAVLAVLMMVCGWSSPTPAEAKKVTAAKANGQTKSSSATVSSPSGFGDKWAVVIGIENFEDSRLSRKGLGHDKAAAEFAHALHLSGFASDHVRTLGNRDASRQSVLSSVGSGWLGKLSRNTDLAVITISTHCFPTDDGPVLLCSYDTQLENIYATAIDTNELLNTIKNSVHAKNVVIIFQTSFTAAPELVAGAKTKFARYNVNIEPVKLPPNYTVLVSSKPNQLSWGTYFSDNFVKQLTSDKKSSSLASIFETVQKATVYDTVKNCAGCKIQTPIMVTNGSAPQYSLASSVTNPVKAFPPIVKNYERAESLYGKDLGVLEGDEGSESDVVGDTKVSGTVVGKEPSATENPDPSNVSEPSDQDDDRAVDQAIETMKVELKSFPSFGPGYFMLGQLYETKDNSEAAVAAYANAVKFYPNESDYYAAYASALQDTGVDATVQWKLSHKANPRNVEAIQSLALKAAADKDFRRSAQLLTEAVRLYPKQADLHLNLSCALQKTGQLKEAVKHAEESVLINDRSWNALVNLGKVLLTAGEKKAAQTAFHLALEQTPSADDGYLFVANALEKSGDQRGAVEALEKFILASDGASDKDADKRVAEAKRRLTELKGRVQ
jgi:Cytochrome c biogenesis factor